MLIMGEVQRTPAAYRRDLSLARQVIGQLRDQALESGKAFQVGNGASMLLTSTPSGTAWTGGLPFLAGGGTGPHAQERPRQGTALVEGLGTAMNCANYPLPAGREDDPATNRPGHLTRNGRLRLRQSTDRRTTDAVP